MHYPPTGLCQCHWWFGCNKCYTHSIKRWSKVYWLTDQMTDLGSGQWNCYPIVLHAEWLWCCKPATTMDRDIYLTAKVEMEVELIVLHSHLVVLEGKCAESWCNTWHPAVEYVQSTVYCEWYGASYQRPQRRRDIQGLWRRSDIPLTPCHLHQMGKYFRF